MREDVLEQDCFCCWPLGSNGTAGDHLLDLVRLHWKRLANPSSPHVKESTKK